MTNSKPRRRGKRKGKTTPVHPNSAAARKWGRKAWFTDAADYFATKTGPGACPEGESQPEG